MILGKSLLQEHLDAITAGAVEVADAEPFAGCVRAMVDELVNACELCEPLDLSGLRGEGADEALVGRILHAIEAECIEVLWGDGSQPPHRQCVLELRDRIRRSTPRPATRSNSAAFYRGLVEGDEGTVLADARRVLALFQAAVTAFRDMVYVHDSDGVLLYVNPRGLAMLRYAQEDLLAGLTLSDVVVPRYQDVMEDLLHAAGSSTFFPFSIEVYAKDGERIPVEVCTHPLVENGRVAAVIGIARDLRLERRLEEEIRRSNTYLQEIVDNAPIGIILADEEGIVREANTTAAVLAGAPSQKALLGVPLHSLVDAENPADVRATLRLVSREGRQIHQRLEVRTRFGARVQGDFILTPVRRSWGKSHGILVLLVDVSEQLSLQYNLLQSEKLSAIGELVAGLAHELNNPMTGILGYAQLLKEQSTDGAVHERALRIEEEAQRCRRIVQNLLSFAQRQECVKAPQDINAILKATIELHEYQLRTDHIEVTLDLAPGLPRVEMDAQAVQRVFLNIVSNAHQALLAIHDRPRRLCLRTFLRGHEVCAEFADNGTGIAESVQRRVFDPFFTTRAPNEAVGLGLSVSYGIVSEHGGTIEVASVPGAGSTFTVALPVRPRPRRRLPLI